MKRLTAIICLLCCAAAIALGESLWTDQAWERTVDALSSDLDLPVPAEYRQAVRPGEVGAASGLDESWMNVLLLSTDTQNIKENFGRADVLLLCAINLKTGDAKLLNLPEDALITIPGLPKAVQLRHVNCFGGPLLTVRALNEALALNIRRYCAVNMEAFVDVVDLLGGVTLNLTEGEAQALALEAGENTLNGVQALRYVRLRRQGDGSPRARLLLQAMLDRAMGHTSLDEAFTLLDLLLPALDTNLTTENLVDLVFALADHAGTATVATRALAAGEGGTLDEQCRQTAHQFLYEVKQP